MNYETRYVLDWTDHVWTEIWSEEQNRWIHCDSCEAAFDEPRLYSEGWGRVCHLLLHLQSIAADASRRYQKMDDEMLERRRAIVRDDEFVSKSNREVLRNASNELRRRETSS